MKFTTLIFDWDGTLINSIDRIVYCLQKMIKEMRFEAKTDEQAQDVIGLGLKEAIIELLPEIKGNEQLIEDAIDCYRSYFFSDTIPESPLFEGVFDVLNDLKAKNYAMAIATGKSERALMQELKSYQLESYFSILKTADHTKSKPNPLMLNQIIDEMGCERDEVVMIGDTTFDLEMGNNAGVASIGITTGVHNMDRLKPFKPIKIFNDIRQLSDFL